MSGGFIAQVPLRWSDLDAQGHVNNALVADYLQEARVDFLLSGDNAHLLGSSTIVVSHQVEFLRPIRFSARPVEVAVRVGQVGAATINLGYKVRHDDELAARARTQLAIVRSGRPRRMTPAEREWFASRSLPLGPLRDLGQWTVGEQAHSYDLRVRWSDLDPYRHVNNVRAFDFVAEARNRLNPDGEQLTRMEAAAAASQTWMVARQDVRYLAEITHRLEPYRVRTGYAAVGRTSMTLVAQIEDPLDGRVLVRTTTVLVCGDAEGNPIPVPDSVRRGLERWPATRLD
ncbi:MAG: thioesterase family protein [Propionicimonas sp.]|uniref:acyl-CoA thioesterase n=1 Tax=Propionicimonas sp. TaxID=1955623 RepID=UPI002B1FABE1|nr:thioesterase family protein [Propionicimonas sp.]MEA4944499.1 thioesterase family protein [Propionicimonas sp.]